MGMRDRKIFQRRAAGRRLRAAPRRDQRVHDVRAVGAARPRRPGRGVRRQGRHQPRGLPVPVVEDGRHRRRPDPGIADQLRRRARLGDLRPDRAGPPRLGRALGGGPAARAWRRSGSARTRSRRGSRRATGRTAPSWSSTSTSSRRAWLGRRSRTPISWAGGVPTKQRAEAPAAILCTLTVDDPTSSSGVKRYMLGREPILTPDGEPLVDAKGRRFVRDERGLGAVRREAPPDGVPAAGARERRHEARRRVLRRALPGDGRGRRRDAALRPRERADPLLTPSMNILVCVKRVPATGGRIVLTPDGPTSTPATSASRSAPTRSAPSRRPSGSWRRTAAPRAVLTLGPPAAEEQLRDAMAIGIERAILLETDGRDWDPVATAGAIVDGDPRPGGRERRRFDLILFGNESADSGGSRSGSASPPRSAGPSSPGSRRSTSATAASTARREAAGGGWESSSSRCRRSSPSRRGSTCRATRPCPGGCGPGRRRSSVRRPTWQSGRSREDRPAAAAGAR